MSTENTETKRAFKGVWIRASLWNREDLTWFQKCLLAEIDNLHHGCFASNAWLAKRMGCPEKTLRNNLAVLRKKSLIVDWGFDGRRRQISVADSVSSDPVNGTSLPDSGHPACPIPGTIDTSGRFQLSKESKETSFASQKTQKVEKAASLEEIHDPTWKPDRRSKAEKLASLKPPRDFPSQRTFEDFTDTLTGLANHRLDLYETLCDRKWRHWNGQRWLPIRDWKTYVSALDHSILTANN